MRTFPVDVTLFADVTLFDSFQRKKNKDMIHERKVRHNWTQQQTMWPFIAVLQIVIILYIFLERVLHFELSLTVIYIMISFVTSKHFLKLKGIYLKAILYRHVRFLSVHKKKYPDFSLIFWTTASFYASSELDFGETLSRWDRNDLFMRREKVNWKSALSANVISR